MCRYCSVAATSSSTRRSGCRQEMVAAERFYLDPTHLNPLPSEMVAKGTPLMLL